MYTTELYFECHITVEPMGDLRIKVPAVAAAKSFGFRPATFLLKKDDTAPDDFFSARSTDYNLLYTHMVTLVELLDSLGAKVKRYKIENTLLDVKL